VEEKLLTSVVLGAPFSVCLWALINAIDWTVFPNPICQGKEKAIWDVRKRVGNFIADELTYIVSQNTSFLSAFLPTFHPVYTDNLMWEELAAQSLGHHSININAIHVTFVHPFDQLT
jgi:hypothetical protein